MAWVIFLNRFSAFINQNDFVRLIAVVAILIIMFKCSCDLLGIIRSVLLAIVIVPALWVVFNFDYIISLLPHFIR